MKVIKLRAIGNTFPSIYKTWTTNIHSNITSNEIKIFMGTSGKLTLVFYALAATASSLSPF